MNSSYQISYEIRSERLFAVDQVLTNLVTTISEFKKNPNLEVRRAGSKPFAVLTNNKPSFYVLSPELYDELLEKLWQANVESELVQRGREFDRSVPVTLDELG